MCVCVCVCVREREREKSCVIRLIDLYQDGTVVWSDVCWNKDEFMVKSWFSGISEVSVINVYLVEFVNLERICEGVGR